MSPVVAGSIAAGAAVAALCLAIGVRGEHAVLRGLRHPDLWALRDAGWERGLASWEALRAALGAVALAIAVALGLPLAAALLALAAPSLWIRLRAESTHERAQRSLTKAIHVTEAALRSDATLPEALRRAAAGLDRDLTSRRIERVLEEFEFGRSLDVALRSAADDALDERTALVFGTIALGIAERLPRERMADLLESLGGRLAHEDALRDEVHARSSGVRQQQWLLAGLVPAIAVYLVATMPTLASSLDTPLGRYVLLPGAAALEIAGIVLGRRIVRGALR